MNSKIPDISGFVREGRAGSLSGAIETARPNKAVLSKHTLRQMLSAQATGTTVGFMIWDKAAAEFVGGDKQTYGKDWDENSLVGVDEKGNEYLIVKVNLVRKILKLVIDSVEITERNNDGTPKGENWVVTGTNTYYYESGSHYSTTEKVSTRFEIVSKDSNGSQTIFWNKVG